MKTSDMVTRTAQAALLLGGSMVLSACEVRHDTDSADGTVVEQSDAIVEPSPAPSTTAASIIREEIAPVAPVKLPPKPVELVLPFPDGADLTPQVERMLVGVLESDAIQEGWPVVLGGHTDSSGNDLANLRASRARAEAVAAWLVEHGVADDRIRVIAFGEQNPLAPNAKADGTPDEQARRANRRVELRIAPRIPSDTRGRSEAGEAGAAQNSAGSKNN